MPMRKILAFALAGALIPVAAEARLWPGAMARGGGMHAEARPPVEMPPRMEAPPRMELRHRSDQDYARDAMRAGAIRPLRDIARQWRGDMPGYDFIGSEYDPSAGSYRLKFMREGSVVWLDVDGMGREIRRSGR
jgi:hypothetical protein